jgi:hypothetical protein
MDFKGHKIDFQEADRRYAELKRQLDSGVISAEEFDAQRRQLMVQDDKGKWWAKSRTTGEWNYHDGSGWVPGSPPGYQPPRVPPVESMPSRKPQPKQQSGQLLSSQAALFSTFFRRKRRRDAPRWRNVAVGLTVLAVLVGIGLIAEAGVMMVKDLNPTLTYALVKDDSGKLSVEVPSEWKTHITSEPEGEKGITWSSFLGESAGPSVAAVNDVNAWRSGARGHKGTYILASKKLAQKYTDDELVALGPNDYSSSCEAGTRRPFDRPPYSGKLQEWNNCSGQSDHTAITLAAAPEDRECVVLLQIGGYLQGEEEGVQHILDTFEADCRGID